ncbi:IucA/IucC family protein [Solwaraspora sp. WMMD406]|uniref:IucA/IucC family protein n=1 Tax=Solwaraspora sp. WMMD406 TaxID=3016095 RepID=UPI0024166F9C|nr:IucA/IucC family protein [Solwaraspora sp. WMMD406]MDG4766134.1 IucA/IucC family protein [Solwaraspora sp. WMMD406]
MRPVAGVVCPDVAATVAAVGRDRPELVAELVAAVPGARAAVLARVWGAVAREPLPPVVSRRVVSDRLVVELVDGRRVVGPVAAAEPFAVVGAGLRVSVQGRECADPAEVVAALGVSGADVVAGEVANSVANLALARAGRTAAAGRGDGGVVRSAVEWEQVVVDGHPLHPGCRTRVGMSTAEVLRYGPEHGRVVGLELVAVPVDRWVSTGVRLPPVLPVHPWQAEHVVSGVAGLRRTGRVVRGRPLMSLRTVSVGDGSWQVKTAVDVQMTSAVRTVSPAAVRNGPVVTGLLTGLAGRMSGLRVLPEVAAGAVVVDGGWCRSLAVVWRRVPRVRAGSQVLPVAALAAPLGVPGGPSVVAGLVRAGYGGDPVGFVADLAGVLCGPVVTMAGWGVGLEAHGQNVLVVVRGGRLVGVWYRDVGGVRVDVSRLAAVWGVVPRLAGDVECVDPVEVRVTAWAAVGVALGEVVAVLAREFGVEPARLWAAVAGRVRQVVAGLPVSVRRVVAREVFGGRWPVKATLSMRLAADPLAVRWAWVDNPLAGLG